MESHAHLAEAKSWGLTHNLVHVELQPGKSWDNIWDILHLKLCNTNIHTYTCHFMEIHQEENEMLATYIHHFKTEAKRCDSNNDTATICIFVKGVRDIHNIVEKVYEKDPQTLSEVIRLIEKLNTAQHKKSQLPYHPSWLTWCPMMTTILFLARRAILVTTALRHNTTAVMISNTSQDWSRKIAPSGTLH